MSQRRTSINDAAFAYEFCRGGDSSNVTLDSTNVEALLKSMPVAIAAVMRAAILNSGGDPAFLDALDIGVSTNFNYYNSMRPDAR